MKYILIGILLFAYSESKDWEIKRNPFVVSKNYMEQTGKHYLMPKDTYGFLDIKIIGSFYKKGKKSIMLDLADRGMVYMQEGEEKEINTPDLLTKLKVVKIEKDYTLVTINDGEAIRYEIE